MKRKAAAPRDQHQSAFSRLLEQFCDSCGVTAAALVDGEGETVDYAGRLSPFDIKIAAAECAVLLGVVRETQALDFHNSSELFFRGALRSYGVFPFEDGYALVVVLPGRSFSVSERGLQQVLRGLVEEAGVRCNHPLLFAKEQWEWVEVLTDLADKRKPIQVKQGDSWLSLEVFGRFSAYNKSKGFRVRLENGAELNLLRERLGIWYAEDLPASGEADDAAS